MSIDIWSKKLHCLWESLEKEPVVAWTNVVLWHPARQYSHICWLKKYKDDFQTASNLSIQFAYKEESTIMLFYKPNCGEIFIDFLCLSIISAIWKDWHNWESTYRKKKSRRSRIIKEISSERQNIFNQILRLSDTERELLRFLRRFQEEIKKKCCQ